MAVLKGFRQLAITVNDTVFNIRDLEGRILLPFYLSRDVLVFTPWDKICGFAPSEWVVFRVWRTIAVSSARADAVYLLTLIDQTMKCGAHQTLMTSLHEHGPLDNRTFASLSTSASFFMEPRKKTAFSIRDLLGLRQNQDRTPNSGSPSELSLTHKSSHLPDPRASIFSLGAPPSRQAHHGGYPYPPWGSPLIDSLTTSGQTILNFNIFQAANNREYGKTGK